ncbi:nucleoside phosphorylase [Aquirufa salirivi]|uniref:Nucleoside phosphorylase n=1 Tax=Aquirufa salirivi TaxID=3104729 RepID=A0ABW8RT13_9BACT
MTYFSPTDLIINPDGSSYHLNIRPEQLCDTIFMVGDPERVEKVSCHFDRIHFEIHRREFVSHFGELAGKPIGVLSSGIGADNVEIVMNELDALANIDFETRVEKSQKRSLNLIRMGTSGSIQEDIPVDSVLISEAAIGFDNLAQFYDFSSDKSLPQKDLDQFCEQIGYPLPIYGAKASNQLVHLFTQDAYFQDAYLGTTLTAPGFYAPQGRTVRMNSILPNFLNDCSATLVGKLKITNIEMETSAYYAFSGVLGHEMISLNAILANRKTHQFSSNPEKQISQLIEKAIALFS